MGLYRSATAPPPPPSLQRTPTFSLARSFTFARNRTMAAAKSVLASGDDDDDSDGPDGTPPSSKFTNLSTESNVIAGNGGGNFLPNRSATALPSSSPGQSFILPLAPLHSLPERSSTSLPAAGASSSSGGRTSFLRCYENGVMVRETLVPTEEVDSIMRPLRSRCEGAGGLEGDVQSLQSRYEGEGTWRGGRGGRRAVAGEAEGWGAGEIGQMSAVWRGGWDLVRENVRPLSIKQTVFVGGGRLDFMFSSGRPFVLKDLCIPLPRFKDLILLFSLVWLLMPPKPFILLQRAMPRIGASRAESVKGGLKLGKTIAAGHQSYNLMLALQLGLR